MIKGNKVGLRALEKEDFLNKVTHFKNGMDSISQLYSNVNSDMLKESNDQNSNFFKKLKNCIVLIKKRKDYKRYYKNSGF